MKKYFTKKYAYRLKKRLGLSYKDVVADACRIDSVFKVVLGLHWPLYYRALHILDFYSDTERFLRTRTGGRKWKLKSYIRSAAQTLLLNQANGASFGHPYHLVTPSPLPLNFSLALYCGFLFLLIGLRFPAVVLNALSFFHGFAFIALFSITASWILEVAREESRGAHTIEVQNGFRIAILLFIASELMLFVAFFWAFFHSGLNPSVMVGNAWIPMGIAPVFNGRIPLGNTWLLLTSGLSLTIAHRHSVRKDARHRAHSWLQYLGTLFHCSRYPKIDLAGTLAGNSAYAYRKKIKWWRKVIRFFRGQSSVPRFNYDNLLHHMTKQSLLNRAEAQKKPRFWFLKKKYYPRGRSTKYPTIWVLDTVIRGVIFLGMQGYEYMVGLYTITDSVFGSTFYALTGLHGFHVFVGVIFLFSYLLFNSHQSRTVHSRRAPAKPTMFSTIFSSYKFQWWSHRIAFDGAVWYWHFVDVIWIIVLYVVYMWPFDTAMSVVEYCKYYNMIIPGEAY